MGASAALAGVAAAAPAQAAVPFSAPFGYSAGAVPLAVATDDFNGDGHPDVVSADNVCTDVAPYTPGYCAGQPGAVWVRSGGSYGTLGPARSIPVGADPVALATGNFNGYQGVAVANGLSQSISVLVGGRTGLQFSRSYSIPNNPGAITTGDFNGDGHTDIAVADYDLVSVFYGDGQGGFGGPFNYTFEGPVRGVAAGSVAHNGADELIVSHEVYSVAVGGFTQLAGYEVSILYGNQPGHWVDSRTDLPTDSAGPVAVADLNGDGNWDIVLGADRGHAWLGNGNGGFSAPTSFSPTAGAGYGTSTVAVADFDGDGHPDMALGTSTGKVEVSLGDGRGGFGAPQALSTGGANQVTGVAAADFVGDGRPDIAAVNSPSSNPQGYQYSGSVGLGIFYNLTPPSWWPSWAAGLWPSVLAQWASSAWPSQLHPWDINAWVPQPVIAGWSNLAGALGFAADARSAHGHASHRVTPVWLRRIGAHRPPAWLTPRRVSRWAAAAERRRHHTLREPHRRA